MCLSAANIKPCVAEAVFTLIGAAWTVLILFTIMFHVCTFCYLVNKSYTRKHLETDQPHQQKAIVWNKTCEIPPNSISGGKLGALQTRTLSGCRQSLGATLLTCEALRVRDSSYNVLRKRKSEDGGLLLVLQHSLQAFLGWAVCRWAYHICPETPSYISVTDTNISFFNLQN